MEKISVTIDNNSNAKLFVNFVKNLYFVKKIDSKTNDKESLPVIWAKKPDVTALFGASGNYKLNLKEIRKSWQRNK